MERNTGLKLGSLTIAYVLISVLASLTGILLIFYISVLIPAIYFLLKFKDEIKQKDIFISILLAALASTYGMVTANFIMGPMVSVMVMSSYMAAVAIFRKYLSKDKILGDNPRKSIIIGIVSGVVLGALNIIMANGNIDPKISLDAIFLALQAGIWEEVTMRFLFYALAVYILKRDGRSSIENILIYILMVAPHLLGHGVMSIASIIILFLFFGTPMAILQRKVDLTSAIIMHVTVDLIRFICLGI
ncbi:hypothetical protein ACCQ41_06335 [Anaerococcus sp. ENR0831]|uniref:CAAX prenyl protease 2/Lysostaphin resistance protein A-like domain-containing protein n=1 Tax=Anaerococcus martiniensis TaxID=3115615 RepID=A0ABW9M9J3_9FIRM